MYSKAKLLGHPIHPMLVAFPVAFYTATLISFALYAADGDVFWCRLGTITNWAGVVMAGVAAIPGLIDWAFGIPNGTEAKRTGLSHFVLNVGASGLFLVNALIYTKRWDDAFPSSTAGLLLSLSGIAFLLPAGFLGWKLVQDHHVGVRLSPEQERLEPQPPITPSPTMGVRSERMRHT